jgi:hypothetical protein
MTSLMFLVKFRLSYRDVEVKTKSMSSGGEPRTAIRIGVVGLKTDVVVSRSVRGENEFSFGKSSSVDYNLVSIKFLGVEKNM